MSDAAPVLYALIFTLAVVVVSLLARLKRINRRIKSLKKEILELESGSTETAEGTKRNSPGN